MHFPVNHMGEYLSLQSIHIFLVVLIVLIKWIMLLITIPHILIHLLVHILLLQVIIIGIHFNLIYKFIKISLILKI